MVFVTLSNNGITGLVRIFKDILDLFTTPEDILDPSGAMAAVLLFKVRCTLFIADGAFTLPKKDTIDGCAGHFVSNLIVLLDCFDPREPTGDLYGDLTKTLSAGRPFGSSQFMVGWEFITLFVDEHSADGENNLSIVDVKASLVSASPNQSPTSSHKSSASLLLI